jgi:EAL domain-containing protein (putative c-di-GMP-specific phosphodiesterase class I)
MRQIKRLGVRLALDDFGTGYSSLSYLKRFPIDVLKIDRSFTLEVTSDDGAASITRAIIAMARSLNMTTVAEGVETQAQLDFLGALGCDLMQGYHIGRPLPVEALTALLAAHQGPTQRRPASSSTTPNRITPTAAHSAPVTTSPPSETPSSIAITGLTKV